MLRISFIPITVTIKGATLVSKEGRESGRRRRRRRRKTRGRERVEQGRNRKGKRDREAVNKKGKKNIGEKERENRMW